MPLADALRLLGKQQTGRSSWIPPIVTDFPEFEADRAYAARNVLSHDYFRVDPEILWATVQQSIPKIVMETNRILGQRSENSS
jgi:uncharacterized protein with HEPN domain